MGEEAVVGEAVGEETTTKRRGFWAKRSNHVFFPEFFDPFFGIPLKSIIYFYIPYNF